MLKLIRALLFLVGVAVLVFLAVDNRQETTISFWPTPYSLDLPLFAVFLIGAALGVILGGLAVWFGGHGRRVEARDLRHRAGTADVAERRRREAEETAIIEAARRRNQGSGAALPAPGRA